MTVCGKARKTIMPFSNLPTNLGNPNDDFHIPSASAATANLTKFKTERTFLKFAASSLASGSFFDWKRLLNPYPITPVE
jgi:hypothetical protein